MELAGGVGYALGPPIGGALYAVRKYNLRSALEQNIYSNVFISLVQIGGFTLPFSTVGWIILLLTVPIMVLLKPTSELWLCLYKVSQ